MEGGEKKFFNKLMLRLKQPSLIIICVAFATTLVTIAGALAVVILNYTGIISYFLYVLAAISLAYSVYIIIIFAPKIKRWITALLKRNKLIKDFLENYSFKTFITAIISLVINLGFVAFNTVFAILSKSVWYGASAVYYFLLSALKGGLFYADNKIKNQTNNEEKIVIAQLKNYRSCGIALLVLELAMTGVVTLMVLMQSPTKYSEIIAIMFAAYTCYKITFSIINVVKARSHDNPQIQSFRNIGLAETALSLVSLQMALVSTFSDGLTDMTILNAIVGFAACAFTIGLGIFMIVRATYKIKILNNNKEIGNERH